MKKNYFPFVMLLLCTVAGCKKDQFKNLPGNPENIRKVASGGDGLYDLLGYGYDATGEYGNASASRFKVIDIAKLKLEHPDRVENSIAPDQYTTIESGANSEDYSRDLSGKFSGSLDFKLFGGTVYGSYKDSMKASNKYSYAHLSQINKQRSVKVNASNDLIIANYLSDAFKSDINTMTPQQLVAAYGTHVLSNIVLGAKLEINYRSTTTSSDKKKAATAGAAAHGLIKFFSLNADFTYDESLAKTNTNQTLSYRTVGGDGTKGVIGEVELDKPITKVNISNWQSTCTAANATLIEIVKDGAIPLSDLIANPAKKEAVRLYINQYLKDKGVKALGDVPVYVYYNSRSSDHYFTPDNQPTIGNGGFLNEGIAFYAFSAPATGTVPVYVYYNSRSGDHYFTPDNQPTIGNGSFRNEGIAFHAYPSAGADRAPVYVYYSSRNSDHYFTPDNQPTIGNGDFVNEGIAFYVPD
ncbi:MAC/perforin domain-containing protein [Pedobacter cryoconitis]|uniref:MACPF domain-containing protein n=1 Tax=Pedobacter cryoconitis TaxID=188932 RepID=A0A7X0MKG9_9SPHI|nr:MAC/perforin domain-containing protein [Pedobacter cryoconitis]MBB6500690.1 hypothetical protein [Pedobacter cryoconitis]